MFKAKKNNIDPNSTDTLIGEGTLFEGRLQSEAGIRIEGKIIGDIECSGDVTVGERGVARSNITARNVIIAGEVHGNVTTKGKLSISPSGQLYGNTNAQSLIIEEGGTFQGTSKMEGKAAADKTGDKEPPVPVKSYPAGSSYNSSSNSI